MKTRKWLLALPLMLALCACPQINPDNPDNPDGPDKPSDSFFNLTKADGGEVSATLVFDYQGGGSVDNLKVETNVDGWSAESDADWCSVATDASGIRFNIQQFGEAGSQIYPRTCQVHIKAKDVFDRTLTIGQESDGKYLYTVPGNESTMPGFVVWIHVPSSGAPVDLMVLTNLVDWAVTNENAWLKAEKIDRTTLRLSIVPSDTENGRYGEITLESIDNQAGAAPFWKINLIESNVGGTGDDYSYGDVIEWN